MSTSKLRQEARGRECQVRLPGICNGNSETVILAHIRMIGISGIGMKAPDILGAWCCSACHDVVDGRQPTFMDRADVENALWRGVGRTINGLLREGWVFKKEDNS